MQMESNMSRFASTIALAGCLALVPGLAAAQSPATKQTAPALHGRVTYLEPISRVVGIDETRMPYTSTARVLGLGPQPAPVEALWLGVLVEARLSQPTSQQEVQAVIEFKVLTE